MWCVKEEFSLLFCVYMDDLSNKLNNVNAGCIIGSSLINHLMYADDLVLMAPSSMDVSMLLSVCSEYGIEHYIKYNSIKSNVMIISCKKLKDIYIPNVFFLFLSQKIYATMMTYLGKTREFMLRVIPWFESFTCVQNLLNILYLNPTVLHYIHASYGVAIEQSQWENCV